MADFEHERLDIYRTAIEWLIVADELLTVVSVHMPAERSRAWSASSP